MGLAQNVRPPGIPGKTPEIAGVTQFVAGHEGNFSTLRGYWDMRRGTQLNSDMPLLLGLNKSLTGMLLLEGGALPASLPTVRADSIPMKGNYNLVRSRRILNVITGDIFLPHVLQITAANVNKYASVRLQALSSSLTSSACTK